MTSGPAAALRRVETDLRADGANPRDLFLAGAAVTAFRHYPDGDLYDRVSRAQAYYHVHDAGGDGHIHLFLRPGALPAGARPLAGPPDAPAHLGAVELGGDGWPLALFATNRWVTAEAWYDADILVAALPAFSMVLAPPWRRAGEWLSALVAAHGHDFAALLRHRDAVMTAASAADYEDRRREVVARLPLK